MNTRIGDVLDVEAFEGCKLHDAVDIEINVAVIVGVKVDRGCSLFAAEKVFAARGHFLTAFE